MKSSPWFGETKLSSDPCSWRICVVLPTRDEAATTKTVIEELRQAFQESGLREPSVVIADDSRDDTRRLGELGL